MRTASLSSNEYQQSMFCTEIWKISEFLPENFHGLVRVVGCGEGVSYVTRVSHLILALSWARPAILVAGKGRGGMFLFLLFLHFHSCSSFFPVPLFYLLYCLFYLFSLGDNTKWPTRIDVSLNPNTINQFLVVKFSVYLNMILFIMFAQSNQGLYCSKLSQCILQAVLMHRLNC